MLLPTFVSCALCRDAGAAALSRRWGTRCFHCASLVKSHRVLSAALPTLFPVTFFSNEDGLAGGRACVCTRVGVRVPRQCDVGRGGNRLLVCVSLVGRRAQVGPRRHLSPCQPPVPHATARHRLPPACNRAARDHGGLCAHVGHRRGLTTMGTREETGPKKRNPPLQGRGTVRELVGRGFTGGFVSARIVGGADGGGAQNTASSRCRRAAAAATSPAADGRGTAS